MNAALRPHWPLSAHVAHLSDVSVQQNPHALAQRSAMKDGLETHSPLAAHRAHCLSTSSQGPVVALPAPLPSRVPPAFAFGLSAAFAVAVALAAGLAAAGLAAAGLAAAGLAAAGLAAAGFGGAPGGFAAGVSHTPHERLHSSRMKPRFERHWPSRCQNSQ